MVCCLFNQPNVWDSRLFLCIFLCSFRFHYYNACDYICVPFKPQQRKSRERFSYRDICQDIQKFNSRELNKGNPNFTSCRNVFCIGKRLSVIVISSVTHFRFTNFSVESKGNALIDKIVTHISAFRIY